MGGGAKIGGKHLVGEGGNDEIGKRNKGDPLSGPEAFPSREGRKRLVKGGGKRRESMRSWKEQKQSRQDKEGRGAGKNPLLKGGGVTLGGPFDKDVQLY